VHGFAYVQARVLPGRPELTQADRADDTVLGYHMLSRSRGRLSQVVGILLLLVHRSIKILTNKIGSSSHVFHRIDMVFDTDN
jgi:hypothetical protein